ncbi:Phospholipase A(1) DAD1, chloroplastic [Dendrobium catenatum]|uniref:Phospholipase A(1) DAD1, chloroplastic n=1 Tax=Dendrobium catenatum TaxID=906689 RepID=A0A2I0X9N8_9ASPA|nr:Phospholipase A(1) DAD1, chloroplastic [Dendrobium catenatum]
MRNGNECSPAQDGRKLKATVRAGAWKNLDGAPIEGESQRCRRERGFETVDVEVLSKGIQEMCCSLQELTGGMVVDGWRPSLAAAVRGNVVTGGSNQNLGGDGRLKIGSIRSIANPGNRFSNGPLVIKDNISDVPKKISYVEGKGKAVAYDNDIRTLWVSKSSSEQMVVDPSASSSELKIYVNRFGYSNAISGHVHEINANSGTETFGPVKFGFKARPNSNPWSGIAICHVGKILDSKTDLQEKLYSRMVLLSTDPTWNEDFTLNIKLATAKKLQVNAWDANLVTPHKRMGNGLVNLQSICDGENGARCLFLLWSSFKAKVQEPPAGEERPVERDGAGFLSIGAFDTHKDASNLGSALRMVLGSENLNVSQFVESAFGQLKSFNYNYVKSLHASKNGKNDSHEPEESLNGIHSSNEAPKKENIIQSSMVGHEIHNVNNSSAPLVDEADGNNDLMEQKKNDSIQAEYFWKAFTDIINQTVFLKLGVSLPEIESWDKFDLLNNMSIQLRRSAEEKYVEFGLATPKSRDKNNIETSQTSTNAIASSSTDIRIASRDLLSQTDAILGALVVLAKTFSKQKDDSMSLDNQIKNGDDDKNEGPSNKKGSDSSNKGITLSTKGAKEMRELFSSAESAMEAWAMLATSLGRSSFIKSEFEKICFLDNVSTDTQVAIWRDSVRRRLVVAFRGTEQAKWKDLLTDLMFLPAGLNPERLGGDFKQEVQVHGGFLNAYDSVRNRLLMLIKLAIGYHEEHHLESMPKWNVYVTGHSLGGALATLLALEISTSPMAKHGMISVTMYNFGSPRVGNRRFADIYNEKVKDSWRVVNHRDIIPTVPRLMGYCHVAQPVYLAAGDLEKAMLNRDFRGDGYEGDVIGEATPEVLVSEFMKGEKQLIEKILQTEINLLQSIRDGTALMQHMEDFYYISLLESVRSNYMLAENTHSYGKSIRSTA